MRVALITGSNTGIGLALAKRLATHAVAESHPLVVVLGCRSAAKVMLRACEHAS